MIHSGLTLCFFPEKYKTIPVWVLLGCVRIVGSSVDWPEKTCCSCWSYRAAGNCASSQLLVLEFGPEEASSSFVLLSSHGKESQWKSTAASESYTLGLQLQLTAGEDLESGLCLRKAFSDHSAGFDREESHSWTQIRVGPRACTKLAAFACNLRAGAITACRTC